MKRKPRIYYSDSQKAQMWERWRQGDSFKRLPSCLIATIRQKRGFWLRQSVERSSGTVALRPIEPV